MGKGGPGRSRGRCLPVLVVGALLTILLPVLKGSLPTAAASSSHPIAGHGRRVHQHQFTGQAVNAVIKARAQGPAIGPPLGGNWTSLGPQPITGSPGDPVVSGRITSLAVDPGNSAVVYAGAAGGGVWKSTDGGAHWAPKSDTQLSLAIGALAIDPNNPAVIYAGTGEGNGCGDCLPSQGVLKSIDGGGSWVLLGATAFTADTFFFEGLTVDRANSQHLLAATNRGLYQSADAGATWAPNAALSGGVNAVIQDPTTPAKFWAATADWCHAQNGGIAVSTDAGTTWKSLTLPSLPPASRIGLGVGANGVAYAGVAACGVSGYTLGQLAAVLKTSDGGASWRAQAPGSVPGLIDYFAEPGSTRFQGWYDTTVGVDPTDASHAVFGGVTMLATTDGGSSYHDIAKPYTTGPIHADFHAVAFTGANRFYTGNDGGVWKTANLGGTATAADWTDLSGTLGVTQYYAGDAIDSTHMAGGAQDTGTSGLLPGGPPPPAWLSLLGGDGGGVAMIPGSTRLYAEETHLRIFQVDTTSGTESLAAPCGSGGTDPACLDRTGFIAPFKMDPANTARLYAGSVRVFRSTSGGLPAGAGGWTAISGDLTTGTSVKATGDVITTMSLGSGPTAGTLLTGSRYGKVFRSTNADSAAPTWTEITGNLPAFANVNDTGNPWIAAIVLNPANGDEAWVALGAAGIGRIWHTLNASAGAATTWSNLTGAGTTALPAAVVDSLTVDPLAPGTLYAGTDLGATACTTCGGATAVGSWAPLGIGLPNVRVDAITLTRDAGKLVAWTHGRGAWSMVRPAPLRRRRRRRRRRRHPPRRPHRRQPRRPRLRRRRRPSISRRDTPAPGSRRRWPC